MQAGACVPVASATSATEFYIHDHIEISAGIVMDLDRIITAFRELNDEVLIPNSLQHPRSAGATHCRNLEAGSVAGSGADD